MKKRYIPLFASMLLCSFQTGCNLSDGNSSKETMQKEIVQKDEYVLCAEQFASEYIEEKYGFLPEILDSHRVTSEAGLFPGNHKTDHVLVQVSDGEREFSVLADVYAFDKESVHFSDNYQSEKIRNDVGEWVDSQLPGLAAITIESDEAYFFNYYTEYYDGENLLDFLGGMFFYIRAYYVNHDFSDASQLDFLEKLDAADVGYDYMFISCRSEEAVEQVRTQSFPNQFEAHYFIPYIAEYIAGFRNAYTKETPIYYTFNIHDTGEFLYSTMEDTFYKCDQQTDYTLNASQTSAFDDKHKAVSPCWEITGEPACLRIFIPLEDIDYDYEIQSDSKDYTYDMWGEYTTPTISNSSYVYLIGDYACFDMTLRTDRTESSSIGIFESDTGKIHHK